MTSRYFAAFCLRSADDTVSLPARLREAIGRQIEKAPDRWSIVFNPRRNAAEAPFDDLCNEVGRILERCK